MRPISERLDLLGEYLKPISSKWLDFDRAAKADLLPVDVARCRVCEVGSVSGALKQSRGSLCGCNVRIWRDGPDWP